MKQELIEGVDYYVNEKGLITFTEKYHTDRGYCCGIGCKHCPYQYKAVPEPKRSDLLNRRKNNSNQKENNLP